MNKPEHIMNELDFALDAFEKAKKKLIEKGKDYNSGDIKIDDYYLYGEKSIIHEIWKKILRLRSLEFVWQVKGKPVFESKEDTLIDLINYAAIYYSYLQRHKNG